MIVDNGLNIYTIKSIDQHEANSNVYLPPIYKVFVNTYNVGRGRHNDSYSYLHEKINQKLRLIETVYLPDPENVMFGDLFSIEEALEVNARFSNGEDGIPQEYFIIGEDGTGHYLFLVGRDESNRDQIFIEAPDLRFPGGKRITKLANNIFDFIRSFVFIEREGYNIQYSELYKKWGESFWRGHNK